MMCFGATLALEMRDGKWWEILFVRFNETWYEDQVVLP